MGGGEFLDVHRGSSLIGKRHLHRALGYGLLEGPRDALAYDRGTPARNKDFAFSKKKSARFIVMVKQRTGDFSVTKK